jgi:hypothetical protein
MAFKVVKSNFSLNVPVLQPRSRPKRTSSLLWFDGVAVWRDSVTQNPQLVGFQNLTLLTNFANSLWRSGCVLLPPVYYASSNGLYTAQGLPVMTFGWWPDSETGDDGGGGLGGSAAGGKASKSGWGPTSNGAGILLLANQSQTPFARPFLVWLANGGILGPVKAESVAPLISWSQAASLSVDSASGTQTINLQYLAISSRDDANNGINTFWY